MPKLRSTLSILGILERPGRDHHIDAVAGIDEGQLFSVTPRTAGQISTWKTRPLRADIARGMSVINDGFCTRFGDVYDYDGRRLNNVSHKLRVRRKRSWLKSITKERRRWLVKPKAIDVPILNLTASTSHMYFHWLLDVLPRIFIAREAGLERGRWLYVSSAKSFQRDTLEALGLLGRTIEPDASAIINAHDIATPVHQIAIGHLPPNWVMDFLRGELLSNLRTAPSRFGKRLYVSRNDADRRHIRDEDALVAALAAIGFEKIVPGHLSVSEQAATFANAEIIVGAHGSSLANLVFCQPATKVVELFSNNYFDEGPYRLAQAVDLDYYYVRAREVYEKGLPIESDYAIAVEDVFNTLKLAGVAV